MVRPRLSNNLGFVKKMISLYCNCLCGKCTYFLSVSAIFLTAGKPFVHEGPRWQRKRHQGWGKKYRINNQQKVIRWRKWSGREGVILRFGTTASIKLLFYLYIRCEFYFVSFGFMRISDHYISFDLQCKFAIENSHRCISVDDINANENRIKLHYP